MSAWRLQRQCLASAASENPAISILWLLREMQSVVAIFEEAWLKSVGGWKMKEKMKEESAAGDETLNEGTHES